jgi:probable F420-dependent oxidoreductase
MRFWLSLVNVPEVDQFIDIARFAEEVGFDGITIADHLVMPMKYDSKYLYTGDGKTWWPDDLPWADPLVTLAALGAATTTLQLATNIYLLGLRDPFTAAKAIGTASLLTNDRIRVGIGSGWIREEYDIVDIDFDDRGKRIDEMIEVMRKLWTGETVSHQGERFQFEDALMAPAPPRKHVPILVGGSSKPALRRAARNDGWMGVPQPKDELMSTIDELHRLRAECGATGNFEIVFSLMGFLTQELARELESKGAGDTGTLPWMQTPWGNMPWLKDDEDPSSLDIKKKTMERYAEDVIRRVNG